MTHQELLSLADMVSDKIRASNTEFQNKTTAQIAELSSGVSNLKNDIQEIKSDLKGAMEQQSEHGTRLTKMETEKGTFMAICLSVFAIASQVVCNWKFK